MAAVSSGAEGIAAAAAAAGRLPFLWNIVQAGRNIRYITEEGQPAGGQPESRSI